MGDNENKQMDASVREIRAIAIRIDEDGKLTRCDARTPAEQQRSRRDEALRWLGKGDDLGGGFDWRGRLSMAMALGVLFAVIAGVVA